MEMEIGRGGDPTVVTPWSAFVHKFCKFKARRNVTCQLLENVSLSLISLPCLY